MRSTTFLMLLLMISIAFSQDKITSNYSLSEDKIFAFNHAKFELMQKAATEDSIHVQKQFEKRSGLKAGLFSAVIPGAGQFYNKNYWRAAVYAGLEIALWGAYAVYTKNGDDVDAQMRAYADEHWSENWYWSFVYQSGLQYLSREPNDPLNIRDDILALQFEFEPGHSPGEINDMEYERVILRPGSYTREELAFLEKANNYTHDLPRTHTQQYYEMIYKYLHQFGVGWDDIAAYFNDPFYYDRPGSDITAVTPNIAYYRDLRNQSNDHYETATMMLNLVMLNHLVSAVDAVITANLYNKKLNYSINIGAKRSGDKLVKTFGLAVNF